ncbi:protease pro-enzyme activation domain-containing protein [Rhodanobacter sp. MP7CTX1]|uniref:protease pro-enzyme activation domain-containing protein n=1 Tax=Rhodanobacter sp. MP7CTX1 TaxID=2723084 RepID=UPI001607F019|nr:protease pro-enzyme activation domain-containing protein [Rhodanobacter sp. MP7CTX1]MBB6187743.1 subtilase family serine protease [Rhodanobacter sp. MP7CTX1]
MTISLALAAAAVMSAQASTVLPASAGVAVASSTTLHPGDAFTGVLAHTQPMHIVVALKVRNSDELDALVVAHQTLTPARFSSEHAPTQAQAQAVATYLTQTGFTNVVISPNHLLVSADGTAATAQAAFQTSFARVQTKDGRQAFANNSDAHVPAALQDSVLSVIGLQNAYVAHTFAQRAQAKTSASAASVAPHDPTQFSSIYGGSGVPTAAGVTVGIITEGDMTQSVADLNTFTANNSLATVNTQVIYVGADSGDTSGNDEWSIDTQDIIGASGGQVGQLILYVAPSLTDADLLADFNAAVTANVAKVINVSIGGCETDTKNDGTAAASDQIFELAVAQGQTFSIATGDRGADECQNGGTTPSWPADSPYVVAVGGTTLDASTTTWSSETVWVDAGGSPSTFEPKPSWQNALVPGTKRGLPDIAMDADPNSGAEVYVNGGLEQWGGTSLASPIFVGLWARMIAVKGTSIGFAAPLLYQLPAADFHDITVGNNGGEVAKVGYDFASGRGSVILGALASQIGVPSPLVANFSETAAGLVAKFTDTSTDSAGTITSHVWNFGDGGAPTTAINTSHLYPKAGAYTVSETVTDTAGYVIAKTTSVTIK